MATWHSVKGVENGQSVSAETFNEPIAQLAARTDYLKDLLDKLLAGGDQSSIKMNVSLSEDNTPAVGDIVCVDPVTKRYVKAIASMDLYDAYTASERAFAIGLLVHASGTSGTVVLYGKVDLSSFQPDKMVDDGVFTSGQYYLSSTVAGKITMYPKGPRILLGFFARTNLVSGAYSGDFALINPQHMDIESHSHRTYQLLSRPCGQSRTFEPDASASTSEQTGSQASANGSSSEEILAKLLEARNGTIDVDGLSELIVNLYDNGVPTPDPDDPEPDYSTTPVVKVVGYDPEVAPEADESNDGFTGVPRLVVGGDWTADRSETYVVEVSDAYGNTPTSWSACYVKWRSKDWDGSVSEETSVPLRFFGDTAQVGEHGLTVRLEPSEGMDEASPFQCEGNLQPEERTWIVSRESGRGWAKADANSVTDLPSGNVLRLSGVSDRDVNDVVYSVPKLVFDISARTLPETGDVIEIDGIPYTFTNDPDDVEESHIQILETTYQTMVQLAGVCEAAFYDDANYIALVGAESVKYNGVEMDPVLSNADSVRYAILAYSTGELLPNLEEIADIGVSLPVFVVDVLYVVKTLRNGMTAMVAGGAQETVGSSASVSFRCVPGAVYRYNIEFDNDLKLHFPPVPARSGSFMLNGIEVEACEHYGDKAVLCIGDDSLYWRDGTLGRQPWPFPEMSQTDAVNPEDEYRELFHFVSEFHSETGPVTSLHAAKGSPITIHRCGTDEDASVGDLELDVDLTIGMSDQNVAGYRVPKASRNGRLLLGPVVEKLVAGPGISFSRKAGMPEGQGTFTISADGTVYQGDFETIAMENAKLDSIGMFPYIRLLKWIPDSDSNIPTAFVAKFHLPATANNAVYRVKFYASVFGEESFSGDTPLNAGVTMDYNILPDYNSVSGNVVEDANLKTGLIKPDAEFTLDIPFGVMDEDGNYAYSAYDPVLVHNDSSLSPLAGKNALVLDHSFPIPQECRNYIDSHVVSGVFGIKPGYTVAVRFSRSAPSNGTPYTAPIGFLNLRWCVEEVATIDSATADKVEDIVTATVVNLRKAAAKAGSMESGYEVVNVLQRLLNALK